MSSAGSVCWTKRGANPGRKPAHRRQVGPVGPVGPSWPKILTNSRGTFVFSCVFFPLSFWGGLEVSSNRNPASPKKCQFIEAEEVLSSDLRMKAACGAAFFFLNLFPGVDLDERNFPPVIRKGSLKRHQFFSPFGRSESRNTVTVLHNIYHIISSFLGWENSPLAILLVIFLVQTHGSQPWGLQGGEPKIRWLVAVTSWQWLVMEPQGQPFINGCFNGMMNPNLCIENGWKSPNIHL